MEPNWRYDIVRKVERTVYWLEGAAELSVAKSHVAELFSFWPGEYQIFDLETKQVVFTSLTASTLRSGRVAMPVRISVE